MYAKKPQMHASKCHQVVGKYKRKTKKNIYIYETQYKKHKQRKMISHEKQQKHQVEKTNVKLLTAL